MKLTKREKIMLIVLGALLFAFLIYNYVIKVQLNKISELEKSLLEYENKVNIARVQASPNNKIFKDFKILNTKIAGNTQSLLPGINQEKIILILEELFTQSEITATNYSFQLGAEKSLSIDEQILEELTSKNQNEKVQPKTNPLLEIAKTYYKITGQKHEEYQVGNNQDKLTITISFSADYSDLLEAVKSIESYENRIVMKSINISSNLTKAADQTTAANPDRVGGSMVLEFYAVPKLHSDQDAEYLKWEFENPYGKDNPFKPISGFTNQSTENGNEQASNTADQQKKTPFYNFILLVKPITSDLPTIVLGDATKSNRSTYVYADNQAFEDVEIQVKAEGGKYYYKYMTTNERYPIDYENKWIEFFPKNNEIGMRILSEARKGDTDKSGVNLTVLNHTGIPFNVSIFSDDQKMPRVNILKQLGNVKILR